MAISPEERKRRIAERRATPEGKARRAEYRRRYRAKPGIKERDRARDLARLTPERRVRQARQERRRRYGIDPQWVEDAKTCHICGHAIGDLQGTAAGARKRCVDHDHATGKVRGILCHQCNRLLGLMGDTVEGAQRFVDYLGR